MAFKFACVSLFVCVIACCSSLSKALPFSYLRDSDQVSNNGFPYQNQQFTYLNDNNNGVNQVQQTLPYQTIGYPNGLVQIPNNVASTNVINNVNTLNTYPVVQNVPLVSNIQPAFVGGAVGYQQTNQIINTQSAPVQINYGGVPSYSF